ncbi:hypothetical protein N7517_010580 [Penicillium concentricum]|uniref:Terpenoid synthase n=1 Tax=Penicillium concentricum TaxID=293559 RepID=A0A9W9R9B7_9EURO|nr:uncharacterized protein N7517_010580 [Penicillium concentricum]KAJ5355971.1 hypothetical protein N7517_010580 [Penicillium concentricum]
MSSLSAGRLLFEQIYDVIGLLISKTNVAQWIGPSHPSRQTVTEKSQEPNHGVTKNQYEALMNEFLQSAGVKSKHEQKPSDCLETAIFARIEPVTPDKRLAKAATKVGALVALYFYPAHGEKELFLIGLYTACFLVVEDSGHLMIDDLARFRQRMMTGEKQPELFELMKWLFVEFDQCFPTLCANKLFTGILNAWSIFEVEYDQSPGTALIVASASPLFPKYFRNMTGSSEAYVYFLLTKQEFSMSRTKKLLHAVPELLNVTDELNDLFSFYKESVVDIERAGDIERDNFVYQEACVKGIPVIDVLQSLARQIHQRQAAVDHILKDDAQLKRLAREYMVGQMKFYLISERYRLSELELV